MQFTTIPKVENTATRSASLRARVGKLGGQFAGHWILNIKKNASRAGKAITLGRKDTWILTSRRGEGFCSTQYRSVYRPSPELYFLLNTKVAAVLRTQTAMEVGTGGNTGKGSLLLEFAGKSRDHFGEADRVSSLRRGRCSTTRKGTRGARRGRGGRKDRLKPFFLCRSVVAAPAPVGGTVRSSL